MEYQYKIIDYVLKELNKDNIFILSGHFLSDDKYNKLIDEYILLTDYDKDKLTKKEVINCKNELLSNDVELKKTLEKLNSLKCIEGKSTLNTELIKAIVKKYRSNVSYTSTEIKKFDYPGPTAQFKLFNRNVKKQLINVEKRISILSQINEIEDLKNDIADITSDIYSLIERYFLEEVGTDIYSILRLDNDLIIYEKTVYKIHTISDVNSFIREVMDINYDLKSESIFYRGHSNISYELTPSIYRNQWIKYESNLFRELILRHPSEFNNQRYTFEMLTKMQHYDLPTRLLDITSNPLIALYFACSGNTERTAEVFVFKVKNDDIKYYDSDTVSCVSNIVKTPHDLNIKLLPSSKKEFNSSEEIKKLLHEIRNEKPHFKDEIIKADLQKTIFVKPKLNNERIIRQSGAFILFGIEDDKYTCAKASNIYKKRKIHKYIIEGTKKREILVALAKLGITHSHLFPEIDKTSNQLKQDYLNMV